GGSQLLSGNGGEHRLIVQAQVAAADSHVIGRDRKAQGAMVPRPAPPRGDGSAVECEQSRLIGLAQERDCPPQRGLGGGDQFLVPNVQPNRGGDFLAGAGGRLF